MQVFLLSFRSQRHAHCSCRLQPIKPKFCCRRSSEPVRHLGHSSEPISIARHKLVAKSGVLDLRCRPRTRPRACTRKGSLKLRPNGGRLPLCKTTITHATMRFASSVRPLQNGHFLHLTHSLLLFQRLPLGWLSPLLTLEPPHLSPSNSHRHSELYCLRHRRRREGSVWQLTYQLAAQQTDKHGMHALSRHLRIREKPLLHSQL